MSEKQIPTVKGFIFRLSRGGWGFAFWCPYCRRFHHHGWTASSLKERKDGHRVAHCSPESNSLYRETGYYLERFTKAELKEIGEFVKGDLFIRDWVKDHG